MQRCMRRLPAVVVAILMAVSVLPFVPATARSGSILPETLEWVEPASDPDAVMTAITLHDYKLPPEFEERLRYAGKDGTLQVTVSLTSRDPDVERAMSSATTWLAWYGDAPRFLGRVSPDQLRQLLESPYVVFVEPDLPVTNFTSASTLDARTRGEGTDPEDPVDPTPTPTPTTSSTEEEPDPDPATQTRYYFHSDTAIGNADLALGANLFDTQPSEWTDDAHWGDVPFAGNGGPNAPWDPNWKGSIDGTIDSFTADFWQRSLVGDAVGQTSYDVTIWVGSGSAATRYDLPQIDAEVEGFGDPQRITQTITTMHVCSAPTARCSRGSGLTPEVPLDIDPSGQPVTISIAGRYLDSQAAAVIVYDSVSHPSGFVIGSGGGTTTSPSPTPTASPTEDPDPEPVECGSYTDEPNDRWWRDPGFVMEGGQWGIRRIQANAAWSLATGCGVNVAVLDTGQDFGHPDFACSTGKVKVVADSDRIQRDSLPQDENGHGTHVAGIVGACTDNGEGVAGVAPDSTIMPIRVLGADGAGNATGLAEGIRVATASGAHVINMSLGWPSALSPVEALAGPVFRDVEDAITEARAAGVVLVAAAGNEFQFPLCSIPAIAQDIICVGASDPRDLNSWYSNFPVKPGDDVVGPGLLAPGGTGTLLFCQQEDEDIISTYLREGDTCGEPGYQAIAGSSMASPHVAAVAALAYERLGGLRSASNGDDVIAAIIANTDDIYTPGYDPMSGYGRLNALKVVQALSSGGQDPTTTPSPTGSPSPSPSPTEDPDEDPQETQLSFTEDSASRGQYTDTAIAEAALSDEAGEPIAGASITFKLFGDDGVDELVAVTDEAGLARAEFMLERTPGDYQLLADYAGEEGEYLAASAATPFTLEHEETVVDVNVEGRGQNRTVHATLTDHDTPMRGVEGATLLFFVDGEQFAEAVTDGAGQASAQAPPGTRGNGRTWDWEVMFRGDDHWRASSGVTRQ